MKVIPLELPKQDTQLSKLNLNTFFQNKTKNIKVVGVYINITTTWSNSYQILDESIELFGDLPEQTQRHYIKYEEDVYKAKADKAIREYEMIKLKCDKTLYDNKQYIEICKTIDELQYCQATSELIDLISSINKSKALKNIKYKNRLNGYSTISCT